ncbi:hypothetical protein [Psychrobacter sp. I-STPA6b]|uniref:hypothetical protein n=1 Tax=Psychrobacter sp. I-STPA6b TaxID=2585718 RepID=UPI001D0C8F76|nr:hypothetical protein [Psychrobacter sp. I-STPA6b]
MKKLTLAILQVSTISALLLATSVQAAENTSARLAQQEAEAARLAQQEAEAKAAEPARLTRQNNHTANVTSIYDSLAINDDIVLTDTQKQAVEYLTDASVQIIDIGQIVKTQSGIKLSFQKPSQQSCLTDKFMTSEGYQQYQHDRAVKYVVSKTPQQIQQDIKLLTPQLVSAFHSLIANGNREALNDPAILSLASNLIYSSNYQDLREYINFKPDFSKNDVVKYFLWSMTQCDVSLDDLNKSE